MRDVLVELYRQAVASAGDCAIAGDLGGADAWAAEADVLARLLAAHGGPEGHA